LKRLEAAFTRAPRGGPPGPKSSQSDVAKSFAVLFAAKSSSREVGVQIEAKVRY